MIGGTTRVTCNDALYPKSPTFSCDRLALPCRQTDAESTEAVSTGVFRWCLAVKASSAKRLRHRRLIRVLAPRVEVSSAARWWGHRECVTKAEG